MDEAVVGTQHQNTAPLSNNLQAQDGSQEKMLKQSEVNELVFRLKQEAYEKGKQEALKSVQPPPQQEASPQSGMGGMPPSLSRDDVNRIMDERTQQQAHLAAVQNTLNQFTQQMSAGKGKYSDFDETVARLGDLKHIPHIVQYATDNGNAGDIMYELGRNPGKIASLTTLAYINPDLAKAEMKKLADSIKTNEAAKDAPEAPPPLSQVKFSNVGTDSGKNAVRDLRRKAWARA